MIGVLEKIVFVLAGFTVTGVGGGVTALALLPPLRSGIPDVAADSAIAASEWLDRQRQKAAPPGVQLEGDYEMQPVRPQPGAAPQTPQEAQQQAKQQAKQTVAQYYDPTNAIPPEEQVPNIPWVRKQPGVLYKPPKRVPEIIYRKYQSFEDTWDLVQEGGGEFVETDAGTAYQVNWVNENSLLATKLGLQPGDKVIAVNGQPVGKSLDAGKAMFEQLKGERRFAVLIERRGQKTVLSFSVDN